MVDLASIFPSKFVKASDLGGNEISVVIERIEIEKLNDGNKLAVYFQGKKKGMIVNRTNADRIAASYGNNTDQWIGREITLFVDLVPFQGKTVEAIRVKIPPRRQAVALQARPQQMTAGKQQQPVSQPVQYDTPLDDDIPF